MAFVVPVALEKLGGLGDPAMEVALSVVGTKDGLEYRAVQLTLKHFTEKAVPRLEKLLAHEDYKRKQIERVIKLLPGYRLVLIGDSGERDPEVSHDSSSSQQAAGG